MSLKEYLERSPKVVLTPSWDAKEEFEGIRALTFEGAEYLGRRTKIFAYLGFPKKGKEPVPAVVLVHGGGGMPFLPWVKQWNDRGYAAIAFSATGDFPTRVNAGFQEAEQRPDYWSVGMWGDFLEEGYIDPPVNDCMSHSEAPVEEQWMYHAVAGTILAHNVLRADERIDPHRIGLCGISWGGVIASIAVGYDHRFAFAVPIYGSGYLTEDMGVLGNYFRLGRNPELWLAEDRLQQATMPILWQCDAADECFSLNSNSKSYLDTVKQNPNTRLSIVYNMRHSHRRAWRRGEALSFADGICQGGQAFPTLRVGDRIQVEPANARVISLRLFYLTEPMSYVKDQKGTPTMKQKWQWKEIPMKDGARESGLSEEMRGYYYELTTMVNGEIIVVASPYAEK